MKQVLIVDDTATNIRILELLLTKSDCYVHEFIKPEDCLTWAENNISIIDLAIIDFQMPSMNGDDLAAALRKLGCNVHIVILTAHNTLSMDMLNTEASITTIINKPISMKDVKYMINRWSERDQVIDARREPHIAVDEELHQELFLYKNGFYKSFHAHCINRSQNGIAFKLLPRDAGIISTGDEILLDNGINYSVRWSRILQKKQCFGLSQIQ